ncbi:MAG: ribosome maturation factor RimM [Ktedonobacterales bacterium]|nr:ribosome maturation factor RimM [Ktedonobacterales bacterium]
MSKPDPPSQPPAKRRYGRPKAPPHPVVDAVTPEPTPTDWVVVGRIVATFGLKGDVKLAPQTDFPERLAAHKILYLGPEHRSLPLVSARVHGTVVLLRFAGIDDITAAEGLRHLVVSIPATKVAPLNPDQFYVHDLIGLRAVHVNGHDLGVIADVYTNTAQDLLVVRQPGKAEVLVPLVKALVPQVDIAARVVTIDPPGGLFDEDWIEA